MTWLKEGEHNTIFFHVSTLIRRRRNKIFRLKGTNGDLCKDEEHLKQMTINFYKNLYKVETVLTCNLSEWGFPELIHHDRRWLNLLVIAEEIKEAIFHMGPHKSPGSNSFSSLFF